MRETFVGVKFMLKQGMRAGQFQLWFTQFWEFGPHTWGAINYKGVQSFGQQIEGVALTEN